MPRRPRVLVAEALRVWPFCPRGHVVKWGPQCPSCREACHARVVATVRRRRGEAHPLPASLPPMIHRRVELEDFVRHVNRGRAARGEELLDVLELVQRIVEKRSQRLARRTATAWMDLPPAEALA